MKDLIDFYQKRIAGFTAELTTVKKKLFVSAMLRLGLFLMAAGSIYWFWGQSTTIILVVLATVALFVFLVSRHSDLQYQRDRLKALIDLNQTEIEVLGRNFHQLPGGDEFMDTIHPYSQDVDLFGKGSFYQYSNRTVLQQGSEWYAQLLLANDTDNICQKQKAAGELAPQVDWRQEFSATATLIKSETPIAYILKWLDSYPFFIPNTMKWLPSVFSGLSVLIIALFFTGFIKGMTLLIWFFLGLGITGVYLKKINMLSNDTDKILGTFQQYQKLVLQLERQRFQSVRLLEKQKVVLGKNENASTILRKFGTILGALDQRNNMLFGIFGNAFLLWDLHYAHRLEQWIREYGMSVAPWFETVAFFDAQNTLGNFVFNHPHYAFPAITDNTCVLDSQEAGHPLLDPDKNITNDFHIDKGRFFVITGANMAGKSTFLRTISLQIIMANMGLPVYAKHSSYSPIKLITSMRTSDSLTNAESYFFSELKRLKFIVETIKDDRYFIVLDEILKGTNSTDKAEGSRKFVERLAQSGSTGLIATHDLSLCKIAATQPAVENHYFDAQIVDDELFFDYQFKKGICQNMNASFLLKKMGIVE